MVAQSYVYLSYIYMYTIPIYTHMYIYICTGWGTGAQSAAHSIQAIKHNMQQHSIKSGCKGTSTASGKSIECG